MGLRGLRPSSTHADRARVADAQRSSPGQGAGAAYGTTTLILASAAQLAAGRAADRWGGRGPTIRLQRHHPLGHWPGDNRRHSWGSSFSAAPRGRGLVAFHSDVRVVADGVSKRSMSSALAAARVWSISMIAGSCSRLARALGSRLPPGTGLLNFGAIFLALAYYGRTTAHRQCGSERPCTAQGLRESTLSRRTHGRSTGNRLAAVSVERRLRQIDQAASSDRRNRAISSRKRPTPLPKAHPGSAFSRDRRNSVR